MQAKPDLQMLLVRGLGIVPSWVAEAGLPGKVMPAGCRNPGKVPRIIWCLVLGVEGGGVGLMVRGEEPGVSWQLAVL